MITIETFTKSIITSETSKCEDAEDIILGDNSTSIIAACRSNDKRAGNQYKQQYEIAKNETLNVLLLRYITIKITMYLFIYVMFYFV